MWGIFLPLQKTFRIILQIYFFFRGWTHFSPDVLRETGVGWVFLMGNRVGALEMEEGNNKRQTSASVVAWLAEVCLDGLHCPVETASGDAVYFLGLLWRMRAERIFRRVRKAF